MAGTEGVATMNLTGRTNMAAQGPLAVGARLGLSFGDWLPPHGPGPAVPACPWSWCLWQTNFAPGSCQCPRACCPDRDRSGLQQDFGLEQRGRAVVTVSWDGHT